MLQNADTFGALMALALLAWSLSRTIPLRPHHRHHAPVGAPVDSTQPSGATRAS